MVERLADLPAPLRAYFEEREMSLADAGQPFQSTDLVSYPPLPTRSFVRAYHDGDRWAVWFEHGGRGFHWHIAGFRISRTSPAKARAVGDLSGEACAATKAILGGVESRIEQLHY